jgi:hypothetical protein
MPEEKTDAQIREDKIQAAMSELASKPGPPRNDRMIAALLRERAGLEAHGKSDRVEQVNEQLKAYGYETDEGTDDDKSAARKQAPQGRSARPHQTGAKSDG